jgi:hypothetical protein
MWFGIVLNGKFYRIQRILRLSPRRVVTLLPKYTKSSSGRQHAIVAFENRMCHKSKRLPDWCLHGYLKVLCDDSDFIYSVQQSNKIIDPSTALPWRWKRYDPSKSRELSTQRHIVESHKASRPVQHGWENLKCGSSTFQFIIYYYYMLRWNETT